jgi:hypothetical protein
MDRGACNDLATPLAGVRRTSADGLDVRDALHQHPHVFVVPSRFAEHVMVVADLDAGEDGAAEDAVESVWRLQAKGGVDSGGEQGGW